MKGRLSLYIITLLVLITLLLPKFFSGGDPTSLILNEKTISKSIMQSLPALILLVFISLNGSSTDRRRRGWTPPKPSDIPIIIVFLVLTIALGMIFPAGEGSYNVDIQGLRGIILIFLLSLVVALTEELFFRSWLMSTLPLLGWPLWLVLAFSVVSFASMHIWQGWTGFVFAVFSGAAFSIWFMKRPGLFALVCAHTIYNTMALWVMSVR
jgi:membrane protease YdiL (CAAX protease family)